MSLRRPWLEGLIVAALFAALAIIATWPAATGPGTLSVIKPTDNDYRFHIYVIFWGAHALTTDPLALHHTNMFHPERYTYAYSDMELSHSLLMLPVILASGNPILTYNLFLILAMVLGGVGFYFLAKDLTGSRTAAIAGAVIFVFNPAHFVRYVQTQLFGDYWLPWFAWAMLRWLRSHDESSDNEARPSQPGFEGAWLWPILAGLFACLLALSSAHLTLFGATLGGALVIYYGLVGRLWRRPLFWKQLLVTGTICGGVLAPVFWPYLVVERHAVEMRTLMQQLVHGSAGPVELLSAGSRFYRWLDETLGWPSGALGRPARTYVFPGLVTLSLAAFGFVGGLTRRNRDQIFWAAFFVLCLWIALGPNGGLYMVLEKLPVLRLMRVPSRFFLPAAFALAVLSAYGVARLQRRLINPRTKAMVLTSLFLLFAVESLHAPLPSYPVNPGPEPRHRFLAEQPGDFTVVEFPLDPHNYTISTRQIFNSIYHWKKLLVGYSGFQTPENVARLQRLQETFPSDRCLDELEELDVRYVIVLEARLWPEILEKLHTQARLQQVRRFGDIGVYELLSGRD